jgi:hypothetical protein
MKPDSNLDLDPPLREALIVVPPGYFWVEPQGDSDFLHRTVLADAGAAATNIAPTMQAVHSRLNSLTFRIKLSFL